VSRDSRILLFVHDPTDAEVIEMQLRKAHVRFSIQRVSAKDQLMSAVRTAPPDCIIADSTIPRLDVAALMAHVRSTHPSVLWIILTPATGEDTVVGWMKAGAADVITRKNFTRMGPAVAEALAHPVVAPVLDPPPPPAAYVPEPPPPSIQMAAQADLLLMREVLDHASDLITLLDARGSRLYNNPAHRHILDAPEHLKGTVAFVDVHPDDRARVTAAFLAGLREGKETRVQYRLMDNRGRVRILESIGSPVRSGPLDGPRAVVVSRDVTDRVRKEKDRDSLMRAIGPVSGESFFVNLVTTLARTLRVRYVLVSECVYQPCERVRSLAFVANGSLMPPFEYDIADTTCEAVFATRGPVHHPDRVQELFPRMEALVTMGARSYLGVPLVTPGGTLTGHLFLMDDRKLVDPSRASELLLEVASRTAMEVERYREDEMVRASEIRLRSILESLDKGVLVVDMLSIITYLNGAAAAMGERDGMDVIGKPLAQFLELGDDGAEDGPEYGAEQAGLLVRKDGTHRAVISLATPLKDASARVYGTIYILRPAGQPAAAVD
jgi:PAS domain S-box-containing protein